MFGNIDSGIATSLIALISTVMFTLFVRSIITVFRYGVFFRAELATKKEQQEFEQHIKSDLRGYKEELLNIVLKSSDRIINDKVKALENLKDLPAKITALDQVLDQKIKNLNEKLDAIKSLEDNVRSLNTKVNRLEYGQTNADVRRKEK
jgi:biopolymer transport protein ExbB/TolQ